MSKEEQFKKIKKYLDFLDYTIDRNKAHKPIVYGNKIFNLRFNIPLMTLIIFLTYCTFWPLRLILANFALLTATGLTILAGALPFIIHAIIFNGNGKYARGYNRLEMDDFIKDIKSNYKDYFKNIMKAKTADEVSQEEIDRFINLAGVYAYNYKHYLDKNIFKRVEKRNREDYAKIEKLYNKMNVNNKDKILNKIEKIIIKNNEYTENWCHLYNTCAHTSKYLYFITKTINKDLFLPEVYKFKADYRALNRKVKKELDLAFEGLDPDEDIELVFDNENELQSNDIKLEKASKLKANISEDEDELLN